MNDTNKMASSVLTNQRTEEKSNYIDEIITQLVQVDDCVTKLQAKMAACNNEEDKATCQTQIDGLKMKKYRLQEMLDMQKKGESDEHPDTVKTNIQSLWNELKDTVSSFTDSFKSNK